MKITFICVGQVKKSALKEPALDYLERINRYAPVELAEVRDEPYSAKVPREDVLKKEGQRILQRVREGDYVVALSEEGKSMTSAGLSRRVQTLMDSGRKGAAFIVGGAYGMHSEVYQRADLVLSLSAMTFPHDMARLMLFEQVYRAFTILRGEPYSH